jgi:hypothetical protein
MRARCPSLDSDNLGRFSAKGTCDFQGKFADFAAADRIGPNRFGRFRLELAY